MKHRANTAVNSGNYYSTATRRVLNKLKQMGILIPNEAVSLVQHLNGDGAPRNFSKLEHAMLDWFSGLDYDRATALIHGAPQETQWHLVSILDFDRSPADLSHELICPSRQDAVAAVLAACDASLFRIDASRGNNGDIVFMIDGHDVIKIQPIVLEPFNLEIRDRVRNAFKGLRQTEDDFFGRLSRLPGFKGIDTGEAIDISPRASMMLSFPGNWALAMRNALEQVGVTVKLSQAQELAAAFFGASSWHQLVKHQDTPVPSDAPVAVSIEGKLTFYHTTEEALFATGKHIEAAGNGAELVALEPARLNYVNGSIMLRLGDKSELEAMEPIERIFYTAHIQTGTNDYWIPGDEGNEEITIAAKQLLSSMDAKNAQQTALNPFDQGTDARSLLETTLARAGIPAKQIVYMGNYVLAASFDKTTPGARLQVYHLDADGPRKVPNGDVAMYKADVRIVEGADGEELHIAGDYGKSPAVRIPILHWGQVQRLADLAQSPQLFSLVAQKFDGKIPPIFRAK